ncbi:MAG: NRDE family protein [Archangium sp.]|nr:NRDE family protein [Archangium sp.]
MCTLIVSVQQHQSAPLIVAANRDELRGRPASPPRRWEGAAFVAPRDDQAGGSWLGLTSTGMFVGVTNRFPSERFLDRQSRGALVIEALKAPSARALRASLEGLSAKRFNPFHLLYADAQAAFVTWSDGAQVHHDQLAPGLHVVTERSLGGDDHGRSKLISSAWPSLARVDGVPTAGALQGLLARPNPADPAGGVCVDWPEMNYGTRSSLVLFVAPQVVDSRWFWAEGRPDKTPFVESPELISALAR